jgi:hypothetical protein
MPHRHERRGHGRRRLAHGDDVQWPSGQDILYVQGKRAVDDALRADRVNSGADDTVEIGFETG